MSKLVRIDIVLKNENAIILASREMGERAERVNNYRFRGYLNNDAIKDFNGIVIKRDHGGDIGFQRQKNGTFVPVMDDMQQSRFMGQFRPLYSKHVTLDSVKKLGYGVVSQQTDQSGTIKIVCRKW